MPLRSAATSFLHIRIYRGSGKILCPAGYANKEKEPLISGMKQQAQRIYENVPLLTLDFFGL
jgi:hypothetical protein